MAIDVNKANRQSQNLGDNISQLRNAKKQMLAYKTSVSGNWQGKEVGYINSAIDRVIRDIDNAIRGLDSLSNDIRNTAAQIRREEEAAAARARQQRIRAAQTAYDNACGELNALVAKRDQLNERFRRASFRERLGLTNEIVALNIEIDMAEKRCESAYNALRAAKG